MSLGVENRKGGGNDFETHLDDLYATETVNV